MNQKNYSPESYFNLTDFTHRALFDTVEWVWQALDQLEVYLEQYSFKGVNVEQYCGSTFIHSDRIFIGEGTRIEAGSYIQGPCVIGKGCTIRHGAYIRGNVLIGDRCIVGHTTELKSSILLNHARAAHFAFVGDSILGNDVNLGAGVRCANLRLDNQPIKMSIGGVEISTGRRKLGSILGDGVQIGCNVVLNPGTMIGKHTKCCPLLNLSGIIPENMMVRPIKKLYELVHE